MGNIYQPASVALVDCLFSETKVWSSTELELKTPEKRKQIMVYDLSLYMGGEGSFANGAGLCRQKPMTVVEKTFAQEVKRENVVDGMVEHMSTPHVKSIAITLLSMSPSTCPIERSFSVLDTIHKKARNQSGQDRVEDLLFIVINSRLLNNVQLDDDFVSSVLCNND